MVKFSWFFSGVYSFFDNMTSSSMPFLAGTSAVIAALLALTTIIFSQYNERLIQKTNGVSKEIKNLILNNKNNCQVIVEKINEMIFLLSNQSVYKITLYFFFIISYISGILWMLVGIGYILDLKPKNSGDLTVIILSTIAISATFFVLPVVLLQFNKNPALVVDIKNRVSFDQLIRYFKSITRISNTRIIKNYIHPSLTLKLSYTGSLVISLKQEIPASNITYIYEFVGSNNSKQIIKIVSNSSDKLIEYDVNSKNKYENNFEGLFSLIKNSKFQKLYVYSNKSKKIEASYTALFICNNETEVAMTIAEEFNISADDFITDLISSKKWIHVISDKEKTEYHLIRNN